MSETSVGQRDASVSPGAGLLTEVFGMGNGLRAYVGRGFVDYATAKRLLLGAVSGVVEGTFAAHLVDPLLLKATFSLGLLVLGAFFVYYDPPGECIPGESEGAFLAAKNAGRGETVIEAQTGETFQYDTCWRASGVVGGTIGIRVGKFVPEDAMEVGLGVEFVV